MPIYFKESNGKVLRCSNGKIAATCHCFAAPSIQLVGTLEWLWVVQGRSTNQSLNAYITNIGGTGSELNWASSFNLAYVSSVPGSGQADFGETDTDVVTLDVSTLVAGDYSGQMTVRDSVLSQVLEKTLPITIKVVGCAGYPATMYWWYKDITDGTTGGATQGRDCGSPGFGVRYFYGLGSVTYLGLDMVWKIWVHTSWVGSWVSHDMEWNGSHVRSVDKYVLVGGYLGHTYWYYCSSDIADKPSWIP